MMQSLLRLDQPMISFPKIESAQFPLMVCLSFNSGRQSSDMIRPAGT